MKAKALKPFRAWLNEQPRSALRYRRVIPRREEIGWTTEDFVLEANYRGAELRMSTASNWCKGAKPKPAHYAAITKRFPGVRFS